MQKRIRLLFCTLLAFVIILSIVPGVTAIEQEQESTQEQQPEPTQEQPEEPTQEQVHVHEWVLQGGGDRGHNWKCNSCAQTKLEDHTLDSTETCTICGYYSHTHNWQRTGADGSHHTLECSGCGEKKTVTHTFDSSNCCTVCGYTKHKHTWVYDVGRTYDYNHGLRCTQCDALSMEDHIYGSDGTCTVCGRSVPHEHQWKWNGGQDSDRYHILGCTCGKTAVEEHQMMWDGKKRDSTYHGIVCKVCGITRTSVHSYDVSYVNGEKCLFCGYETVKHTWKYNNYCFEDGHEMICNDCNTIILERHRANSSGKCVVCNYEVSSITVPDHNPTGGKPTETEPSETGPDETASPESTPDETGSSETIPDETDSQEMNPTEVTSTDSNPTEISSSETTPLTTQPMSGNTSKEDVQGISNTGAWVAAVIVIACSLGATAFIRRKKSS